MAPLVTVTKPATTTRTKVMIPLPQGAVPDNYIFGRLVRVTIASTSAFKLFGGRVNARPIGVYVESYEAAGGAVWDSTPADCGNPFDKYFDQVRFELDTDGAANVAVYTDLPGEAFASRGSYALTTGATGRHWATVNLPAGLYGTANSVEGRSIRLVASSAAGFRIYRAQVRSGRIGRYLAGAVASGGQDDLSTLEFDFQSQRIKLYKRIEIDLRTDGPVGLTLLTEQSGQLAVMYSTTLYTPNGRKAITLPLPPGIKGRLLRIALSGGPARVFHMRVWTRPLNEPQAKWEWANYPLEDSEVLPSWTDLPVEATPPNFEWANLPVNPTEAQWFWAKVLSVEETPETWQWIDVPFEVIS
jgi:hypothetical protein